MRKKLANILINDISSLFAGTQLAFLIVSFLGLGGLANWIIEYWFPLTRLLWDKVFTFMNIPEITTQEKDSLTTIAFFVPMAISSFANWKANNISDRTPKREGNQTPLLENEKRHKIYAAAVGAIFIYIVGQSVLQGMGVIILNVISMMSDRLTQTIFGIKNLANMVLFYGLLVAISIGAALYMTRRERYDSIEKLLHEHKLPEESIRDFNKKNRFQRKVLVWILFVLFAVIFITLFSGLAVAAKQLGPIRSAAPVLVLILICATVLLNPVKILKTAGIVIMLILSNYIYILIEFFRNAVENIPA